MSCLNVTCEGSFSVECLIATATGLCRTQMKSFVQSQTLWRSKFLSTNVTFSPLVNYKLKTIDKGCLTIPKLFTLDTVNRCLMAVQVTVSVELSRTH